MSGGLKAFILMIDGTPGKGKEQKAEHGKSVRLGES